MSIKDIPDFYNKQLKIIDKKCKKYIQVNNNEDFNEIYFIPDIHGDFDSFINIMKRIDCISIVNNKIKWNPKSKNICIIQSGDILDGYRPKSDRSKIFSYDLLIIKIMLILNNQAKQYNSKIILLYGNHEIQSLITHLYNKFNKDEYTYKIKHPDSKKEFVDYQKQFLKLKDYIICNYKSVVLINGILVCHCGLIKDITNKILNKCHISINGLNNNDKIDIINKCGLVILNYLVDKSKNTVLTKETNEDFNDLLQLYELRNYSANGEKDRFKYVKDLNNDLITLNQYIKFNTMIIGHNITHNKHPRKFITFNKINTLYSSDVGLSRTFEFRYPHYIGNEFLKYTKENDIEVIKFDNIHNDFTEQMNNNKISIKCSIKKNTIKIKKD